MADPRPSRVTAPELEALVSRNRQLEAEAEQLRSNVASLQERVSTLELERDREQKDWARFKAWFVESVERKRRKRESERQSERPAGENPPAGSCKRKRKLLSQADEAVLRDVGIDEAVVKSLRGEAEELVSQSKAQAFDQLTPKPKSRPHSGQHQEPSSSKAASRPSAVCSSSPSSCSPLKPVEAPSQPRDDARASSSTPEASKPTPRTWRRPRAPSPSSSEFESAGVESPRPAKPKQADPVIETRAQCRARAASPLRRLSPSPSRLEAGRTADTSGSRPGQVQEAADDGAAWTKSASTSSPALTREQILAKRRREMEEMKRDPHKYKGKGRYAKEIPADGQGSTSLNALYEIVPEMNNGVPFAHTEVVRDRATRKRMHAFDCPCCRDWYEAVGGAEPQVFISDLPSSKEEERAEAEAQKKRRIQELKQSTSRHRAFGPPPATPPSYWTIGFPTTQEAEEIQRKAVEADEEKRRQMDADPRYRRRRKV